MRLKFVVLANELLESSVRFFSTALLIIVSTVSASWTLLEAAGVSGGPPLLGSLILTGVLAVGLVTTVSQLKLTMLSWAIDSKLEWIRDVDPKLIVGVGRGGAVVAGLIGKKLSESIGKEPAVCVFDVYQDEYDGGFRAKLESRTLPNLDKLAEFGTALLVSAECRKGDAVFLAHQLLRGKGIDHKIFSVLAYDTASERIHGLESAIRSNCRGIVPWPLSPLKRRAHSTG